MKFSTLAPRAIKGQLKCYDCRKTLFMKDGNWHDRGNKQVFLCKPCDKVQHELRHKSPLGR